jgi:hypothetical protein
MKISVSAFKLNTLKQKLWAIVAASFVARLIIFLLLPNNASIALAPDENGYAVIAESISLLSVFESLAKFFDNDVLGRTLVIPASILIRLGFSDIDSVRLSSMMYGQLSVIVLAMFIWRHRNFVELNSRRQNLIALLLIFFAIWPSRFLWSSLGLRESSMEFFVIFTFLGLCFFYEKRLNNRLIPSVVIFSGITLVFVTRVQVGWLLVISLLLSFVFKLNNRNNLFLVPLVLLGMMAGYLSTSSFSIITSETFTVKEINGSAMYSRSTLEAIASKICNGTNENALYEGKSFQCVNAGQKKRLSGLQNPSSVAIEQIELIPYKQTVNQAGAASQIKTIPCPFVGEGSIQKYACLAWRAPYASLTFLFRPLPFLDTTSRSSYFAGVENLLWILGVGLILFKMIRRGRPTLPARLLPTTVFLILYVVGAGSYEGNMGTAFRHKSLILWIVLLLLFAVFWRGQDEAKEPQGNNSQESAV